MSEQNKRPPKKNKKKEDEYSKLIFFIILVLGLFMIVPIFTSQQTEQKMSYTQFLELVRENPETQQVQECELTGNLLTVKLANGKTFMMHVPANDMQLVPLLSQNVEHFYINSPNDFLKNMFYSILPMLLFFGLLYFFVYRGADAGMTMGSTFSVERPGEDLVDKDTGIVFGQAETTIGSLQITSVEDSRSRAKMVDGGVALEGDILRNESLPVTPKPKPKKKVAW